MASVGALSYGELPSSTATTRWGLMMFWCTAMLGNGGARQRDSCRQSLGALTGVLDSRAKMAD